MEKDTAQQVIDHEARIRMLEDRCEAQEYVLAWLLKQFPDDGGYWFLSVQANELDQPEHRHRYHEAIALLDHLRELLSTPSVSPESNPTAKR